MQRSLTILAMSLALSSPALAQDPPRQVRSVLTIKTSDTMVGAGMLLSLDPSTPLPSLQSGEHFVLELGSDGKITANTGTGLDGWVDATIHPGPLMDLFEDEIADQWDAMVGMGAMAAPQLGLSTEDFAELMDDILAFPRQIGTLELRLSANPQTDLKNLGTDIVIHAAQDSFLSSLLSRVRPHPDGYPALPNSEDNLLSMSVAVDPQAMVATAEPLIDFFAKMGAGSDEERVRNRNVFGKLLESMDGTVHSAGDPFSGSVLGITGLRSGESMAAVLDSSDYAKYIESYASLNPLGTTEYVVKGLEHRDITLAKQMVTMPGVEQTTYTGVAGGYYITATTMDEDVARGLIDAALDQKITRQKLPDNTLMSMDLRLMDLLDIASPAGNPLAGLGEMAPEDMHLSVESKDSTLTLRIRLK